MKYILVLIIITGTSIGAFADGGSSGVGRGGDFGTIADAFPKVNVQYSRGRLDAILVLEDIIYFGLQEIVMRYVESRIDNPEFIQNPFTRTIFKEMVGRGLLEDISSAQYLRANRFNDSLAQCPVPGYVNRSASTGLDAFGDAICFDILEMTRSKPFYTPFTNIAILVGLVLHEYAHHFGYDDENHENGRAFALDFSANDGYSLIPRDLMHRLESRLPR